MALLLPTVSSLQSQAGDSQKGDVDRAKLAYIQATCWSCHPRGENSINGDRPLKGPAFLRRYPDDASLAAFIRKGAEEKGMPAFPEDRLSDKNLDLVIAYIRSLTKKQ
ncbi:MAG: cytochrome c [Candidatus Obscuribacter sp.]|nr:cytochrome c [Candidatus Obscuribacter sp.]